MGRKEPQRAQDLPTALFAWDADYMAQFAMPQPSNYRGPAYRGCARGHTFASRVLGRLITPELRPQQQGLKR